MGLKLCGFLFSNFLMAMVRFRLPDVALRGKNLAILLLDVDAVVISLLVGVYVFLLFTEV